ncbi:hypothetical protein [Haliscomenobacter hydrossis]|uniref:Uncharacterized protein n=1 Tax=Haliscomenobacter hydrossis (strain ATCC 27775 / DSM 1100 / LMG 10767 / O) TaxID=760192 RepID=F4KPI5_HALH1|nr:hypothetical protein [Haliscomenobacter hydrossis]AEE49939.1 hypothetical protein Halhy_2054 [Haliscomenobacter hydrossis DSM 1100]
MPKSIVFCLCLLGGVSAASAQNDNPIVVMAAQGKISYQAPGYKSKSISAGSLFKNTGTVKLKANSSITFFTEGQFQTLQGPKSSTLQDVFPDQGGMKLNFERGFSDFLVAALDLAANPQNPKDAWGTVTSKKGSGDGWGTVTSKKGSGDGWGTVTSKKGSGDGWGTVTSKKGSGDGWGGKGKLINTIAPFGKIRPGAKLFQWSKPAGPQDYRLEIKDSKGTTILKITAQDTLLSVDLDPVKFKEGQQYVWQVSTAAGDVLSNPMVFEIGTSQALSSVVQKAETAESYAKNSASVQGLMRAVALEQGEWYQDAALTYFQLQTADPNNLLIKLMYAAFWMRNGPKPLAEQAFKLR